MNKEASPIFKNMLAIGVGLIGGSVCLSARKRGLVRHVLGFSRRLETTHEALRLGLVDECITGPGDFNLRNVDAVVLSIPVQQYRKVLMDFLPVLPASCLIFDAGSTKTDVQAVVDELDLQFPGLKSRFVGVHPIAGGEKQGPSAASPDLFVDRNCIVCASDAVPEGTVAKVESFWNAMGARLSRMNPADHDDMFGAVSHLPHFLAFAYVAALLDTPNGERFMLEGGAGFRDFTRIAASSPEMWADIFQNNATAMLRSLSAFESTIADLRHAIEQGNRSEIEKTLTRASVFRKNWTQA
ncbi:MAG TPA: prephenate dehydrogenase/arogenate dehydrogenase family protein [Limnobacter sp.]|uniref:prephenate dehydrogenase n=1 Tax=Limnobacter sp. TaxID=2003368 RepID=UPI002E31883E|nr:prephenate dehydrogenase/arogenate dehydrogenase family protein [Limnobacter sp.]HEX5487107.1 prephenate dehydrogenase/arogenate dehydrogenase family protein [Limnobacter sp.]